MEFLGTAAAILRKPKIAEIRETERSVGAEGSSCCPTSAGHLEKDWESSGLCRMIRSDRLNVEGNLE